MTARRLSRPRRSLNLTRRTWLALATLPTSATLQRDPQARSTLIAALHEYRSASSVHSRHIGGLPAHSTLLGAPVDKRGPVRLPEQAILTKSAQETADRFASGLYRIDVPDPHLQRDGTRISGPTVRAIRAGWNPSFNTINGPGTLPPHTGIRENVVRLAKGVDARAALRAWRSHPVNNFTLLKAQARAVGAGFAETASYSYWVLLIEAEAQMQESEANYAEYFNVVPVSIAGQQTLASRICQFTWPRAKTGTTTGRWELLSEGLQAIRRRSVPAQRSSDSCRDGSVSVPRCVVQRHAVEG